jgi:ketosteroid isomerase-like protein
MAPTLDETKDRSALQELNAVYLRSVQTSDVSRFQEILAEDFRCALSDGSSVDKAGFLEHVAGTAALSNLVAHDVQVRLLGDVALIHARTTFRLPDGRPGSSRYTDVWARRNGRWLAVSAHVTRY